MDCTARFLAWDFLRTCAGPHEENAPALESQGSTRRARTRTTNQTQTEHGDYMHATFQHVYKLYTGNVGQSSCIPASMKGRGQARTMESEIVAKKNGDLRASSSSGQRCSRGWSCGTTKASAARCGAMDIILFFVTPAPVVRRSQANCLSNMRNPRCCLRVSCGGA